MAWPMAGSPVLCAISATQPSPSDYWRKALEPIDLDITRCDLILPFTDEAVLFQDKAFTRQ